MTRALEQQLEATTHRMSDGLKERQPLQMEIWKYEDVFVAAVERAPSPRILRQNDFDSLGADLLAICNYEELDAFRNKTGACLIALTSAYMRVLSRTSTCAAARFRNPDRQAEPRAAFREISEICNLTYFTVSFVVLQCDQHMVPQNMHSRRFEEKFIPYATKPCRHLSQLKSRSSLPPTSSGSHPP
jgi:hypothetical protein